MLPPPLDLIACSQQMHVVFRFPFQIYIDACWELQSNHSIWLLDIEQLYWSSLTLNASLKSHSAVVIERGKKKFTSHLLSTPIFSQFGFESATFWTSFSTTLSSRVV